ncbi:hypothetical protein GCM10011613_21970 [Cellvibrio zantedeschiae]|uniref:Secreted protein n=1 Tax=Cellvibrio zantedeschiae TaxID=1237077 RepID=A0ABQ3B343_9GAMM|nr:hypothetical protein GCM10011613_21970 [Cellvibrio zantedeschiae]
MQGAAELELLLTELLVAIELAAALDVVELALLSELLDDGIASLAGSFESLLPPQLLKLMSSVDSISECIFILISFFE